jgi:8-oxo-dGTP diphosphatase/2-hydroxy-dATP diphosphatase
MSTDNKTKTRKLLTLAFIHQHPRVLLGMKKIGFGAGRWNGFGGKVEAGETIEAAARREVIEEAGIEPRELVKQGILTFEFKDDPERILEVHVFKATDYSGDPIETEEMKPQWFMVDEIPFKEMWSDDLYWMPLLLKGKKFKGRFFFDKPSTADYQAKILEKNFEEVPEFE